MAKWQGTDYDDVDIESLLNSEGIPYKSSGKNISAGWIGVNCPFCGEQSYHCGINLDSKRYSCWVCTQAGTLAKYVGVAVNCGYREANLIISDFRGFHYTAPVRSLSSNVVFPTRMTPLSCRGKKYLEKRGFNPEFLEEVYRLKETQNDSELVIEGMKWKFKNRIIIPFIVNREIVSYTGRDWTGRSDPRYQNAPLEAGTVLTSECLYNIDSIKDRALIVEGATDVWKLGKESIATLGVKFSHAQINSIVRKNLKKVVILFDSGATAQSILLAEALGPYIEDISVYSMTNGMDPGSLDFIEAHKLKMDLLGG